MSLDGDYKAMHWSPSAMCFKRWCDVMQLLGVSHDAKRNFRAVIAAYSESHRAYHTYVHVADCLVQFGMCSHVAQRPVEVEVALWFHDVVYDVKSSCNEEASADWAARFLLACGAGGAVVHRVRGLILATKHDGVPDAQDAQLLVDVDLSILGREPARFDLYEQQIRQEYAWVSEDAFRAGRAKILSAFLARDSIFQTSFFRRRYEAQARANLRRSLS